MEYAVRKAEEKDFPKILSLYSSARAFMAAHGNPSQWGSTYPEEAVLRRDLEDGSLYVIEQAGSIHGVFLFGIFEDPTYRVIEQGSWHKNGPYGVLHRVAGDGSGGILKAAVSFAEKQIPYLRMDTHRDNLPMQRALKNQGFSCCGIIYTAQGSPRLAYEKL